MQREPDTLDGERKGSTALGRADTDHVRDTVRHLCRDPDTAVHLALPRGAVSLTADMEEWDLRDTLARADAECGGVGLFVHPQDMRETAGGRLIPTRLRTIAVRLKQGHDESSEAFIFRTNEAWARADDAGHRPTLVILDPTRNCLWLVWTVAQSLALTGAEWSAADDCARTLTAALAPESAPGSIHRPLPLPGTCETGDDGNAIHDVSAGSTGPVLHLSSMADLQAFVAAIVESAAAFGPSRSIADSYRIAASLLQAHTQEQKANEAL